jgi:uncharacterized protein (TIGR03437 family)
VAADYIQTGRGEFAFRLGPYDRDAALVIDPTVVYTALVSTAKPYGGFPDVLGGAAADSAGNVYLAAGGITNDSTIRPVILGYVLKVNAAGTAKVFTSYLPWYGVPSGIAVDGAGNSYVTGQTRSGYPISYDTGAYVAKLSADGSTLVYTMRVGGTSADQPRAIAVDAGGNAYVAGSVVSADFPATQSLVSSCGPGSSFVTKVNPQGTGLVHSTCLAPGSLNELAVDSAGNAYVAGRAGAGFPTTPGAFQPVFPAANTESAGIVFKLNPAGSALVYSTYLGGSVRDYANGIAIDASGNAYITGGTLSPDFPVKGAVQAAPAGSVDAFVTKLNATGSALVYSTYLGGSGTDLGYAIAVDAAGNAYVVGRTSSTDFPLVSPIQATFANGAQSQCWAGLECDDAFIAELGAAGSPLAFSTYFGGGGYDDAAACAVDASGNLYVAGDWGSGLAQLAIAGPIRQAEQGVFLLKLSAAGSLPTFTAQSVTSAASFQPGLVAGEIATAFGQGITNVTGILTAGSLPLPTELAGSSVTVNNVPAPIFAVANVSGQQQINFEVPHNISSPAWVAVSNNGVYSSPVAVNVSAAPGIFTLDGSRGAIQHADFRLVTPSSPAARGETIVLYATGLGAVHPDPGLGNPAAVSPLSRTTTLPTVTIGGKPAQVLFSGLVPGLVALNQLNVVVPADAPSGDVDVVISNPNVSGAASKPVKLAVQ